MKHLDKTASKGNPMVARILAVAMLMASLVTWVSPSVGQAPATPNLKARIDSIVKMSAEEMAATSPFIKRAYDAQIAYVHRIQNKDNI